MTRDELTQIIWDNLHPLARAVSRRHDIDRITEIILKRQEEEHDGNKEGGQEKS